MRLLVHRDRHGHTVLDHPPQAHLQGQACECMRVQAGGGGCRRVEAGACRLVQWEPGRSAGVSRSGVSSVRTPCTREESGPTVAHTITTARCAYVTHNLVNRMNQRIMIYICDMRYAPVDIICIYMRVYTVVRSKAPAPRSCCCGAPRPRSGSSGGGSVWRSCPAGCTPGGRRPRPSANQ